MAKSRKVFLILLCAVAAALAIGLVYTNAPHPIVRDTKESTIVGISYNPHFGDSTADPAEYDVPVTGYDAEAVLVCLHRYREEFLPEGGPESTRDVDVALTITLDTNGDRVGGEKFLRLGQQNLCTHDRVVDATTIETGSTYQVLEGETLRQELWDILDLPGENGKQ